MKPAYALSPSTRHFLGTSLLIFGLLAGPARSQPTFTSIGDISGGGFSSSIRAASEDGTKAAGGGTLITATPTVGTLSADVPVMWDSVTGLSELARAVVPTTTNAGWASDITPDGSVIAGRIRITSNTGPRNAALWTSNGTVLTDIGSLGGSQTAAVAISDNGAVAYGFGFTSAGPQRAFRWTNGTGIVDLGVLNIADTQSTITARGVSADGTIAVGSSGDNTSGFTPSSTAFRHVDGIGMQSLGYLADGSWSSAGAISADGTMVFGVADSIAHPNGELFRWTQAGGLVALGAPAAYPGGVLLMGASGDGTVATFNSHIYNASGFYSLDSVLTGAGLDISGWSQLITLGVSDNGNVLWGMGTNPSGFNEGWVATFDSGYLAAIPEPSTYAALGGLAALGLSFRRRIFLHSGGLNSLRQKQK